MKVGFLKGEWQLRQMEFTINKNSSNTLSNYLLYWFKIMRMYRYSILFFFCCFLISINAQSYLTINGVNVGDLEGEVASTQAMFKAMFNKELKVIGINDRKIIFDKSNVEDEEWKKITEWAKKAFSEENYPEGGSVTNTDYNSITFTYEIREAEIKENEERTVEQIVQSIEKETDSLLKVKLDYENEIRKTIVLNKTKLDSLYIESGKAGKELSKKSKFLREKKQELEELETTFSNRYSENVTNKILKKHSPSDKSWCIETNREQQIKAYYYLKKLKFLFYKPKENEKHLWQYDINKNYRSSFVKHNAFYISGKITRFFEKIAFPPKKIMTMKEDWKLNFFSKCFLYIDLEVLNELSELDRKKFKDFGLENLLPKSQNEVSISWFNWSWVIKPCPWSFNLKEMAKLSTALGKAKNYKKHKKSKIDNKLNENAVYILEGQEKENYIYFIIGIDEDYFKLDHLIKSKESIVKEAKESYDIQNNITSVLVNEILNFEKQQKQDSSNLVSKIKYLSQRINSKENRIKDVYINDSIRTRLINKGDKYLKDKKNSEAFNMYKSAINIRKSPDLEQKYNSLYVKLETKRKIQAKKAEAERKEKNKKFFSKFYNDKKAIDDAFKHFAYSTNIENIDTYEYSYYFKFPSTMYYKNYVIEECISYEGANIDNTKPKERCLHIYFHYMAQNGFGLYTPGYGAVWVTMNGFSSCSMGRIFVEKFK